MDETSPIPVVNDPRPNVVVEFEKKDLSIGTARYTGARPISKNLSMKPTFPGYPDNPIVHANVEVHLYDDQGHEVPMTRRLVRHWLIQPLQGATVQNLMNWRIVGLENSEFSPFSPFPVSPSERPATVNFEWDRPGKRDAPGWQGTSVKDPASGQLQEFLIGNAKVGGAYFQTYTLNDGSKIRVINTRVVKLSADEYRKLLQRIDSGDYSKTMSRRLFFMPAGATSDIQALPSK